MSILAVVHVAERDQIIAGLELHGYLPYRDQWGWCKVWSDALEKGCLAKRFPPDVDGNNWDVRVMVSSMVLLHAERCEWSDIPDDVLEQLAAGKTRKYKHIVTPNNPLAYDHS